MNGQPRTILGWPSKGWLILIAWIMSLIAVDALIVAINGVTEPIFSQIARFHVRAAFVMFWLAFAASPLALWFPNRFTGRLISIRPYLGVCFAVAHLGFLLTNIARVQMFYHRDPFNLAPPLNWLIGGSLYLVIFALAVTSFPMPAKRLGRRNWQILHTAGCYLVALGYLNSFGLRALSRPEYIPWAVLVLVLLSLRIALEWKRHHVKIRNIIELCCVRCCGIGGK